MQRYNGQLINQFASIINGNAAAGAQVTVKLKSTGATVTLYAEDDLGGATIANPLTADAKGYYGFYAPDGVYTLDASISGTPQLEIQLQDVAALQSQFNDALANAGYIPVGTFAAGCTVSQSNGVVSDGSSFWRWDGALPKTVTAGSSPAPTGAGNWILISDEAFRGALAAIDSVELVAGVEAKDVVTHGSVRFQNPSVGNIAGQLHAVVRTIDANSNTNIHQEPNGYVDQGTVVKYDFMIDPFDINQVNYRLGNIYTKTGAGAGFNGQNGVVVIGAKAEGDHFGVWPTINIGFSDDNSNGIPLKLCYFDTSDTAWRTPMTGAWRTGKSYTSGDYCLANFKLYQAANTGTSGATKPSHSATSVSDGGVTWAFIRDYSASAGSIKPTILVGDRNDMPKFGWSGVRMQQAKDRMIWNGVKDVYANNSNTAGVTIGMDALTDDWKIGLSGGGYFRYSASNNFVQSFGAAYLLTEKSITTGTTIDVRATELVYLNYASATSITTLTGRPNQKVFIHSANGNATLVHGASIKLAGAVNKTLSADDMLCFVFNSGGTIAKQVI